MAKFWNMYAAVYAGFSAANTMVFQSCDVLLRFPGVVAALRRRLRVRAGADFADEARRRETASPFKARSRNLEQALMFYSDASNRRDGFSGADLRYMAEELDPALMARWGYGFEAAPRTRLTRGSTQEAPGPVGARSAIRPGAGGYA